MTVFFFARHGWWNSVADELCSMSVHVHLGWATFPDSQMLDWLTSARQTLTRIWVHSLTIRTCMGQGKQALSLPARPIHTTYVKLFRFMIGCYPHSTNRLKGAFLQISTLWETKSAGMLFTFLSSTTTHDIERRIPKASTRPCPLLSLVLLSFT